MKSKSLVMICLMCIVSFVIQAQEVIKVGIIGLDTSHAPAFIGLLNSDDPKPEHQGFRVVAAYPYGSKTIENSYKRIPEYTERAKKEWSRNSIFYYRTVEKGGLCDVGNK